jgi:hypothetical protein
MENTTIEAWAHANDREFSAPNFVGNVLVPAWSLVCRRFFGSPHFWSDVDVTSGETDQRAGGLPTANGGTVLLFPLRSTESPLLRK